MKFFFCFSFLFLTATAEATVEAKGDWQYKTFPYLPKNIPQKKNEPEVLKIGKTPLHALMSRQSGTHVRWGVEQVYLSKNLKKKVFVKYNVSLSSAAPIGGSSSRPAHSCTIWCATSWAAWLRLARKSVPPNGWARSLKPVRVLSQPPPFHPKACTFSDRVMRRIGACRIGQTLMMGCHER